MERYNNLAWCIALKKISVVVPTYNEEENVKPLAEAIVKQMGELSDYDFELIFIDNDSKDNTRPLLRDICSGDKRIKAIFNAKNYGQFSSPYYGLQQATGDCAILMSADFQDPVEMIPKYVAEWEAGYKIVLGQKTSSKESRLVYAARSFYYDFMKKHSDIEFLKQVTGSGLYDRSFIEVMKQVEDTRPFLRGIVAEMGYGIKLVPYEQPNRRAGKSSNNLFRYLDGAAQSLTAYTKFGCRLALGCGVFASIASILAIIATAIYKVVNWSTFSVQPYILPLAILLIVSMNMFFIGVVGEYTMDANNHTRKKPLVVEAERINF